MTPMKSIMLLTSFAAIPAPASPQAMTLPAIGSTISAARATSSGAPPSMKVSVPASAPAVPPEIGASTKVSPRASASLWHQREVSTSTVEVSMSTVDASACAKIPSSPP